MDAILINCLDCVGLAARSGFCGSTMYGIGLIRYSHWLSMNNNNTDLECSTSTLFLVFCIQSVCANLIHLRDPQSL